MMLKIVIFAFLAVGVLGEYLVIPEDRIQQYQNVLRDQCKKNGAEDKYEQAENGGKAFEACIKNYLNAEQVKTEIDAAKTRSALSEVFKKYCNKATEVKTCTQILFDGLSPCVDPSSRYQLAKNATDQFIDFLCEEQGVRMTSFYSEGGPVCFGNKLDDIRQCADSVRSSFDDSEEAKKLTVADKCVKYDEMSTCMVNKVKGCNTTTLASMAEVLFGLIRKHSPCNDALPKN